MNPRCDGKRHGCSLRCNGSLYRCTKCAAVGCTQNKPELCSNQAFDVSERCVTCGATGARELIAADNVGFFSTLMNDANAVAPAATPG
jgi:hypothetical protein